ESPNFVVGGICTTARSQQALVFDARLIREIWVCVYRLSASWKSPNFVLYAQRRVGRGANTTRRGAVKSTLTIFQNPGTARTMVRIMNKSTSII
ncbi:unnamed protein product, partial [Pylaiella littoralis]